MNNYLTHVYHQRLEAATPLYFEGFKSLYRDFEFTKDPSYQLYYVLPRDGETLPYELSCRFTQIAMLEKAIDRFLLRQSKADAPDTPPKPKTSKRLMVVDGKTVEIDYNATGGKIDSS